MSTTAITWAWGLQTAIDFNVATDTLDFGWMSANDIAITEADGSVVISIPSNHQSYTLTGVTLSELSLSNIVAKDSSAIAEWTAVLAAAGSDTGDTGTDGGSSSDGSGASDSGSGTGASDGSAGGTTTAITWAWDTHTVIDFNPATDTLDFGWFSANNFSIAEENGSVVISIPSNHQSYTLTGVTLAELSLSNIVAKDSSAIAEWTTVLAAAGGSSGDTGGTGDTGAGDTGDSGAGGGSTSDGSGSSGSGSGTGSSDGSSASTTTAIIWAWGTHTVVDFNPATDTLDFGWFSANDFSIAEENGSVVISIPSNQQTYTLSGVTLSELSLDSIVAKDSSAIAEWTEALSGSGDSSGSGDGDTGSGDTGNGDTGDGDTGGGDTGGDTGSGSGNTDTDTAYAAAWAADQVYVAGDRASVDNAVFEANWWTQGTDPQSDNGAVGTGHVWTFIGYMDTTPVVPETPEDFQALNTTETTTLLTWDAAEVNGVGTVSAYAVYENGELIGTTDSTYYKVTGLTAGTTYSFSVVATDEAGTSPEATPISVTTDPLGSDSADDQSFSPYVDMALTSSADLVQIVDDAGLSAVTLAFMLSSGTDQIGWQGNGTIADDTLANGTTIESIVDQLQQKGVDVTISFGGAAGQEAALTFSSAEALTAAYQSVIDKYHVTKIDFDIEGSALVDDSANHLRNEAIAALQEANPDLEVSFTLPVLPVGLTQDGLDFLSLAQADGVDIDVVNIMTMDYGTYYESGDMGQDAIDATEATIAQLEALGIDAKIGITPMIGINDIQSEVFTLEDAQQVLDYADSNDNVASIAMWSLSRDNGDTVGYVSSEGSGIEQQDYDFSKIFAHV